MFDYQLIENSNKLIIKTKRICNYLIIIIEFFTKRKWSNWKIIFSLNFFPPIFVPKIFTCHYQEKNCRVKYNNKMLKKVIRTSFSLICWYDLRLSILSKHSFSKDSNSLISVILSVTLQVLLTLIYIHFLEILFLANLAILRNRKLSLWVMLCQW